MSEDKGIKPEPNTRKVLSFKAVVVMTTTGNTQPTLEMVESALRKSGVTFVMPSGVEAPIVISVSDD